MCMCRELPPAHEHEPNPAATSGRENELKRDRKGFPHHSHTQREPAPDAPCTKVYKSRGGQASRNFRRNAPCRGASIDIPRARGYKTLAPVVTSARSWRNRMHRRAHAVTAALSIAFALFTACAHAEPAPKALQPGHIDPRLKTIRTLYQGSNFKPYDDKQAWQRRAEYLRQQALIAAGLWPMPAKTPLNAVIHGQIDRGDYTIDKVYFESHPGFFVTGNRYCPKNRPGKLPAVLSPHGHWANGRLYEAPDKEADRQLKAGEEKFRNAARFPLQARTANLAKLGCVVFFYDMVGYADASEDLFPHRKTFIGADYDLNLLSIFGLQTWNSIRAMDFLLSLPEVDPSRIACTGASGGGTQTFVMMAADDRLKVAAPVCMISHDNHQGGCVCENNALLRLGTDNVELSATFAPKP